MYAYWNGTIYKAGRSIRRTLWSKQFRKPLGFTLKQKFVLYSTVWFEDKRVWDVCLVCSLCFLQVQIWHNKTDLHSSGGGPLFPQVQVSIHMKKQKQKHGGRPTMKTSWRADPPTADARHFSPIPASILGTLVYCSGCLVCWGVWSLDPTPCPIQGSEVLPFTWRSGPPAARRRTPGRPRLPPWRCWSRLACRCTETTTPAAGWIPGQSVAGLWVQTENGRGRGNNFRQVAADLPSFLQSKTSSSLMLNLHLNSTWNIHLITS